MSDQAKRDLLFTIIEQFSTASDGQMDKHLADRCLKFTEKSKLDKQLDPVYFLRDLLDDFVYTGASGFVVTVTEMLLADEPDESPSQQKSRRDLLSQARKGETYIV